MNLHCYPSQSEADYALLGAIIRIAVAHGAPDGMLADVAIRVFEKSGLYREEKRAAVINHAIPKLIASVLSDKPRSTQEFTETNLPRLATKDGVIAFSDEPPPPRVYVLDDLILAVKVCVLAGLGGVSKTVWMMQLVVCVALGLPFMGKATLMGAVLLILGEEDERLDVGHL